jgi:Eukaryotic aspartyl protease
LLQQQPIHSREQYVFSHFLFTTNIGIGTPPQPFVAEVDINWSQLFVPSSRCSLNPRVGKNCIPRHKYNSTASSSHIKGNSTTTVNVEYFMIAARGKVVKDTIYIGELEIMNQEFQEATYWETLYPAWWSPQDSTLGLALFRPNQTHLTMDVKGPFEHMIDRQLLNRNVFALKLPRTDNEPGELILGGYDKELLTSFITLPLTNVTGGHNTGLTFFASSGWQVNVSSMSLTATSNKTQALDIPLDGYTAIISNSADYISMPPQISLEISKHLGFDEMDDLDCNQSAQLPNLSVSFGEHGAIILTPQQYMTEIEYQDGRTRCLLPFSSWWFNDGVKHETNYIILGTPFLSALYSVFDVDNRTISCECFSRLPVLVLLLSCRHFGLILASVYSRSP